MLAIRQLTAETLAEVDLDRILTVQTGISDMCGPGTIRHLRRPGLDSLRHHHPCSPNLFNAEKIEIVNDPRGDERELWKDFVTP